MEDTRDPMILVREPLDEEKPYEDQDRQGEVPTASRTPHTGAATSRVTPTWPWRCIR